MADLNLFHWFNLSSTDTWFLYCTTVHWILLNVILLNNNLLGYYIKQLCLTGHSLISGLGKPEGKPDSTSAVAPESKRNLPRDLD